jgi:ATP-dependent DNA helicase RecQ
MPGTLEAYYQEAGRAGRDGAPAGCYLLHAFPDRFTHEFFIKGAYPDRPVVEEVYEVLRRSADQSGGVDLTPDEIASRVKTKTSGREVESALRILAHVGAYAVSQDMNARVVVRLLATPERIKRELGGNDSLELGILRAMWRVVGVGLSDGATLDLDGLPPGFGGSSGATPLLDALQSRQFLEWRRAGAGASLTASNKPLTAFHVDWGAIDRRRNNDLKKLDLMQQYAYTKGCRRGFVLRYFGDPAARTTCGGCDNCLGSRVDVERGAAPSMRAPASRGKMRRRATSDADRVAAADEAPVLSGADEALLARLRDLRRTISKAEMVPAYVVFPDRTLAEMAVRRPSSPGALGLIRGVGPVKLEKYGEQFLALIRSTDETEAA